PIGAHELAERLYRRDPRLGPTREARSQHPARLDTRGRCVPRLIEDSAATIHTSTSALSFGGYVPLGGFDRSADLGANLIDGPELRRDRHRQRDRRRHRTVVAKEVQRPTRVQRTT